MARDCQRAVKRILNRWRFASDSDRPTHLIDRAGVMVVSMRTVVLLAYLRSMLMRTQHNIVSGNTTPKRLARLISRIGLLGLSKTKSTHKLTAAAAIGLSVLLSGNAQALTITAVSAAPGTITVSGTCNVNAGNTSLWIKPHASGPTFTQLAGGNGNCANGGPKTKTVSHALPPGNYKVRLVQGSNFFTWPSVVVLP
jgi:hypothetical protein